MRPILLHHEGRVLYKKEAPNPTRLDSLDSPQLAYPHPQSSHSPLAAASSLSLEQNRHSSLSRESFWIDDFTVISREGLASMGQRVTSARVCPRSFCQGRRPPLHRCADGNRECLNCLGLIVVPWATWRARVCLISPPAKVDPSTV